MNYLNPKICISFDVEEFDLPLEYGISIDPDVQMEIGMKGLKAIEPILNFPGLRCILFTTANFADHFPDEIKRLSDKHEIASHTYFHSHFETRDLLSSRLRLEEITGKPVSGLRMPRMMDVPIEEIIKAGYSYDSSIHPTWIPGRYNNFHLPRTEYFENGLKRIPASVSPLFRLPLFWLAFKNYPFWFYQMIAKWTFRTNGTLMLYFHPWEFTDISQFGLPKYITKGCEGRNLEKLMKLLES
jgi:hypothetical protein